MIRRCEHSADKKFALINRKLAQDKRLSFQARGLLVYVLSKPSRWEAKDADLMREGGIKKHALNSILSELKTHGYASRRRERQPDGTFAWILELFEEPQVNCTEPLPDFPVVDEPSMDKHALAIDSTGARAGSLADLKRIKEKEPLYSIQELQDPNTIPGLRNQLAIYEHVPFEEAYNAWYAKYEPMGGIGRRPGSKCTLAQYAGRIESYFQNWQRNALSKGNGNNGHGVMVNDQPMKTLKERLNIQ
jgi:hypothetical protein